jgi:hypothetical protein
MAGTHEPLHLDKQSFVQWKIMDIPTILFEYLFSRTDLLNMAMVGFSDYWGGSKTFTSQHGTIQFCMLTDFLEDE